jgi:cytochrome c oxidase cbb3-type subunit III
MRLAKLILMAFLIAAFGLAFANCKREKREFQESPPAATPAQGLRQSELHPGAASLPPVTNNEYEENAYALSEGKRLYEWYNCKGCHADGGGDIGPPLMDDQWIYGSNPENIYATIVEGRPNGMPSFADKIPTFQVWQIVAYVRSLSGQLSKAASPGRNDHMNTKKSEQSKEKEEPKTKEAERPQ